MVNWYDNDTTHREVAANEVIGCQVLHLLSSRSPYRKKKQKKIERKRGKKKKKEEKKKEEKKAEWVCGVGDTVLAKWQGDNKYYPATIVRFVRVCLLSRFEKWRLLVRIFMQGTLFCISLQVRKLMNCDLCV